MSYEDSEMIDENRALNKYGIIQANVISRNSSNSGAAVRTMTVGSLVLVRQQNGEDILFSEVNEMKPEKQTYFGKIKDVLFVPDDIWASLVPVNPRCRLDLVANQQLSLSLGAIAVGTFVEVLDSFGKVVAIAQVKFKNSIPVLGVGVFFGLKIMDTKANGLNDIAKLKHGEKGCPRSCDIVLTVDKIRPVDERIQKQMEKNYHSPITNNQNGGSYTTTFVVHMREKAPNNVEPKKTVPIVTKVIKNIENSDNCPLLCGDEVVLVDDHRIEKGVVRWTGYLNNRFKVGVEFDNPIGQGTGSLDGISYFQSKLDHALFLPLDALIKYSDFIATSSNSKSSLIIDRLNDFPSGQKTKMTKSNSQHGIQLEKCEAFRCNSKTDDNSEYIKQRTKSVMENYKNNENNVKKSLHRKQSNSLDAGSSSFIKNVNSLNYFQALNVELPPADFINLKDDIGMSKSSYNSKESNLIDSRFGTSNNDNFLEYLKSSSMEFDFIEDDGYYDTPKPRNDSPELVAPGELGMGSMVEIQYNREPHYGVIRWIGMLQDRETRNQRIIAGIEMEKERTGFTDGTFNNKRFFTCNPRKALFAPLDKCQKDSRFSDEKTKKNVAVKSNSFGQIDCPVIEGVVAPINRKGSLEEICGKNRGIQGHHNSCYLDATLFAMFAFTSIFDSLLYRPATENDIVEYEEVQTVLRDEIVNPLRKNFYVRADRVMQLRRLMEKLSSVTGLTSEEKDPEEFLNSLVAQILRAEPFLKLSSGQETFYYQLFVEKDERLNFPTVQQLFEQSFLTSDIKLKQVPSCLIIQMPRFGKDYKMYSKILPSQLLDITDVIENSPRQCTVCGKSAEFECKECFGQVGIGNGLESISFCRTCLERAHNHHSRMRHNFRQLTVPPEFSELQAHCVIPRLYMELFAVVCIETSHYVAFVKCGSGSEAPWCFFDSMADRKGEQNGYNIPEMVSCPNLPYWLSEDGAKTLNEARDERQLPEHAKRLLCDAYMCLYQSPELMMYR